MHYRVLAFLLVLMASNNVVAEPREFVFDKSHADITFRVSHLGYSSTHGRFNDFEGKLMLDTSAFENSSVELSIATGSVETSFAKRNTHLKSEDFFAVEKFPTMTFTSTSIVKTSDTTATMVGDLTLLAITLPVSLAVTINKIAPHPRNKKLTAGFTATGVLKRSDWGMDKFVPGIADEIELRLDMEASENAL